MVHVELWIIKTLLRPTGPRKPIHHAFKIAEHRWLCNGTLVNSKRMHVKCFAAMHIVAARCAAKQYVYDV